MSVLAIAVLAVLGLLLLVAILGGAMASRCSREGAAAFSASLAAVDRHLAAAVAADRGWERSALEATARAEVRRLRPGAEVAELDLVQVVDRPGTDEDLAIFRVVAGETSSMLTLGRRDGAWYAAQLEDER